MTDIDYGLVLNLVLGIVALVLGWRFKALYADLRDMVAAYGELQAIKAEVDRRIVDANADGKVTPAEFDSIMSEGLLLVNKAFAIVQKGKEAADELKAIWDGVKALGRR